VLGDTTYGKGRINRFFREEYGLPRLFLHASTLAFVHPRTGVPIALRVPLATDLREFLVRLPDVPAGLLETL
jgi:tRNA pseudouridine65 synthase